MTRIMTERTMREWINEHSNDESMNLNDWDVSNVHNMSNMFKYCESLTNLNISNWNVSNVRNMNNMFIGCDSLTNLNAMGWLDNQINYIHNSANIMMW